MLYEKNEVRLLALDIQKMNMIIYWDAEESKHFVYSIIGWGTINCRAFLTPSIFLFPITEFIRILVYSSFFVPFPNHLTVTPYHKAVFSILFGMPCPYMGSSWLSFFCYFMFSLFYFRRKNSEKRLWDSLFFVLSPFSRFTAWPLLLFSGLLYSQLLFDV